MVVEEPASQSRPGPAGRRTDPAHACETRRAYFTDPATTPLVRLLWNSKKNRMHGATPSRADDAVVVGSMKFWPWRTEIAIGTVCFELGTSMIKGRKKSF